MMSVGKVLKRKELKDIYTGMEHPFRKRKKITHESYEYFFKVFN